MSSSDSNLNQKNIAERLWIPVYVTVSCIVLFFLAVSNPQLEWDMVAYVASAQEMGFERGDDWHSQIYTLLQASVPSEVYANLTAEGGRATRATVEESFAQHMPFYKARVFYIGAITLLWKLGVNPFFASHLISAVCASLCIAVLAVLVKRPHWAVILSLPIVAFSTGLLDVGRYSTPDAVATLSVLLLYWCLFRRSALLLWLLPLSLMVRTDLILLVGLFLAYMFLLKRYARWATVLSGLACVVIYLGLNEYSDHYGWVTVFDYTFRARSEYPADFPHEVSLGSYIAALKVGILSASYQPMFLTYVAVTWVAVVASVRRWFVNSELGNGDEDMDICFALISSIIYVGLHFALFPALWTRFFAAQYALAMVLVFVATLRVRGPSDVSAG